MIQASCHCGAVEIEIDRAPVEVTDVDPSVDRMGVNARLMPPDTLKQVRVRQLDGAVSKRYLDEEK